MYVLQWRTKDWEKWQTESGRYKTIQEAEEALERRPFRSTYRIAEEYTVIRYKAVKTTDTNN